MYVYWLPVFREPLIGSVMDNLWTIDLWCYDELGNLNWDLSDSFIYKESKLVSILEYLRVLGSKRIGKSRAYRSEVRPGFIKRVYKCSNGRYVVYAHKVRASNICI